MSSTTLITGSILIGLDILLSILLSLHYHRSKVKLRLEDYRTLLLMINVIFLIGLITLLPDRYIQDLLFYCVFMIISLIGWIDEHNRINKSTVCQGKVIRSSRKKQRQIVIAEYTVDTQQYETRPMEIPLKSCQKIYAVGDTIEIRYREHKPYSAIIAEDVYDLKRYRAGFILSVLFFIVLTVLYFVLS